MDTTLPHGKLHLHCLLGATNVAAGIPTCLQHCPEAPLSFQLNRLDMWVVAAAVKGHSAHWLVLGQIYDCLTLAGLNGSGFERNLAYLYNQSQSYQKLLDWEDWYRIVFSFVVKHMKLFAIKVFAQGFGAKGGG